MKRLLLLLLFLPTITSFVAQAANDFGLRIEQQLQDDSVSLFGIQQPLLTPVTDAVARKSADKPEEIVLLADGLQAEFVTRDAANLADMFAFWPDDSQPSHLIFCVEGSRQEIRSDKLNPSIQRIELDTGRVETIVRGMDGCDGIRRTPWGTILATEERQDGQAYELLEPLAVSNIAILDRATGKVSDAKHLVRRVALPTIAWEGLEILPSGVVIAGDEWRPGSDALGDNGGSIYKFVPAKTPGDSKVTSLDESPLVVGKVYALRVDCLPDAHRNFPQYGQGCEVGNAAWVKVSAAKARSDANNVKATGYYRPEDLHIDPLYSGKGVRFCWSNTGNKKAINFGEVMCAVDSEPTLADARHATVSVQRFVGGDPHFNSVDNLAFQPVTGNLYVLEDDQHGEIYACLPDGLDRDLLTDGCIRILAVLDPTAEPTGFAFSADGRTAYLSIQHSNDSGLPLVDDYPTDDILRITGFKLLEQNRTSK